MIDQAKGILMAEQHCTAEEAFEILRLASQHQNVKLRDLATAIVNRPQPTLTGDAQHRAVGRHPTTTPCPR